MVRNKNKMKSKIWRKFFGVFRIAAIIVLVYSTSSCVNLSEEITLNEDGTGEYSMYSDMVATQVEMAVQMGMMFAGEQEVDMDSMRAVMLAKTWEDMPENVDSLHTAFEVPDSLRGDPDLEAMLEKFEGFTKGSKEEGFINTGVRFAFSDMGDLNEMHHLMSNYQEKREEEKGGGMGPKIDAGKQTLKFDFDGNTFKKTTDWETEPDIQGEELKMMENIMKEAKFTSIVHLPRKMKSVDKTHLKEVSEDGKTLIFEYSMLDMIMGETDHDFEIVLEKK